MKWFPLQISIFLYSNKGILNKKTSLSSQYQILTAHRLYVSSDMLGAMVNIVSHLHSFGQHSFTTVIIFPKDDPESQPKLKRPSKLPQTISAA